MVFDVSGTIELKSAVSSAGNVTIAGQTAPGGAGITLKNYKMAFGGDNIICRYISSRPGPYKATSSGNDAWGGSKGSNSIVDHCSIGWASDEQWGLYSNNSNYTVQYSVIGPANSWGGHDKGIHGFAIMMGNSNLTYDHNLIIHNVSRNFRGKVPGTGVVDFTNNIIYDWGYQTAYGTIGHVNYVNNTLKAGNSTTGGYHWMNVDSSTKPENFKVYCAGNRMINKDGSLNGITFNNWDGVTVKSGIGITKDNLYSAGAFPITNNGENVSTATTCESAEASYNNVISFAGNGIAPDKRTAIDRQCADETKNGTGSCSGTAAYDGSVGDLNKYSIKCGVTYNYPAPVLTKTITDKDNDGMDDAWELARGLSPDDPTDYKGDYLGDGYMNIEYYINDLTVNSFPKGVVKTSPEQAASPARTAFETIEAESYDSMEGIQTEDTSDTSGKQNIGYIENGDYVMYKRLDFGEGAQSVTFRASGNPSTIELYTDTLGTPLTRLRYNGTGSFSNWEDFTVGIPQIKGIHNLYVKFTGGEGYLMNVNSFVFGKDAVPVSGKLVHDLNVLDQENALSYWIEPDAGTGSLLFGDRDFTITALPDALNGSEMVITACNSKNNSNDCAAFEAAADETVYIALDNRVENVPTWMAGYTKTEQTVTSSNDVTFDVYRCDFKAGDKVLLGSNGQSYMCVNYAVFVQPSEAPAETTETPTETTEAPTETTETPTETTEASTETTEAPTETTEAPTETTEAPTETTEVPTETVTDAPKEIVYGDLNGDGNVDIMDVIVINKYIIGATKLSDDAEQAADANQDGNVDSNDALLILKRAVNIIKSLPVA
ncbi:MAG: carbohydrate-binding protein [Oscillospiraceae bacterium]|nr:carbohydrate-binding protein [Oscillospiraceae bacterium]